jgi:phage shock protein A
MEKTFQEIADEIKCFRELSLEKREERFKAEQGNLENIGKEIVAVKKEISNAQEKLKLTEDFLKSIEKQLEEERERRQNAIALGQNTKTFDLEIKKLIRELEEQKIYYEDSIIGFERRIENLESELLLLNEEKKEIERTIIRFQIVPLVEEWNKTGEKMASILERLIPLADSLGESLMEFRSGAKTIFYSSWEGIDCIAKFYLGDEVNLPENTWPNGRLKNIFDMRIFLEKLRERKK